MKRWYTSIDAVFNKLPRSSAAPLLAFQALTWCDTTSYIANHTKWSSWKIFKVHHGLLKNLCIDELTAETTTSSETFVCRICNVNRTDSIDAAQYLLFSKTGKPEAMASTSDGMEKCPMLTPEHPAPSEIGWRLGESGLRSVLM